MVWARLLAHIAGTVNHELLLKNEYLAAENRILRAQIKTRLVLSNAEKATLAEIGRRLGRKVLEEIAVAARPDTILGWFRKLVAQKFDRSKSRRPAADPASMRKRKNWSCGGQKRTRPGPTIAPWTPWPTWVTSSPAGRSGTSFIATASHPPPKRKPTTSGRDFIRAHLAVLVGTDFFTVEVLTLKGW
jgi:hypothetical protein